MVFGFFLLFFLIIQQTCTIAPFTSSPFCTSFRDFPLFSFTHNLWLLILMNPSFLLLVFPSHFFYLFFIYYLQNSDRPGILMYILVLEEGIWHRNQLCFDYLRSKFSHQTYQLISWQLLYCISLFHAGHILSFRYPILYLFASVRLTVCKKKLQAHTVLGYVAFMPYILPFISPAKIGQVYWGAARARDLAKLASRLNALEAFGLKAWMNHYMLWHPTFKMCVVVYLLWALLSMLISFF